MSLLEVTNVKKYTAPDLAEIKCRHYQMLHFLWRKENLWRLWESQEVEKPRF